MGKGFFITFEGGEGVGKTTQIQRLNTVLKAENQETLLTREPGGTPAAEEIRTLLSHETFGEAWTPNAEVMLLFAARAMHIKDVLSPALEQGKTILCDRYIDSTRVYQGHLQGMDMDFILALEKQIVGDIMPDLTFILDLPAEVAMARVQARGARDHYDRGDLEFYNNLRQGFLKIAQDNAERCVIIDASQDEETIATSILEAVKNKR